LKKLDPKGLDRRKMFALLLVLLLVYKLGDWLTSFNLPTTQDFDSLDDYVISWFCVIGLIVLFAHWNDKSPLGIQIQKNAILIVFILCLIILFYAYIQEWHDMLALSDEPGSAILIMLAFVNYRYDVLLPIISAFKKKK